MASGGPWPAECPLTPVRGGAPLPPAHRPDCPPSLPPSPSPPPTSAPLPAPPLAFSPAPPAFSSASLPELSSLASLGVSCADFPAALTSRRFRQWEDSDQEVGP
ncbi:Hypothetical predicted protein [Xyrichtys novacula]|uniref:Uncharacterized protein n=1 Tax=Xyrichtys novacula TaxID=13765 RepID=A0AAV1ERM5_XYRNO|nr:Hypothetical predicted protein [Xyrichtys novacula]